MASFFGDGPLPDWKEIRRWLGKELPWKLVEQWEKADDGEWMNRFVKGMLNKETEETEKPATKALVRMDTVKNDKRVTVTVRLPPDTDMRRLQIFATSDRLRVTGLPDSGTHTVRFPCRVFAKSGQATQLGDRILIRFRRRPVKSEEVELFIRP